MAGRPGNVPSPRGRNSPPEAVGDVYETPNSFTEVFHPIEGFTFVSDSELRDPPAGDWLHWRGNPSSWGYSPLTQINKENVGRLQLAWVWGMEDGVRSQPAPLERDGILYLPNSGNVIQALDAADGTLLWEYRRQFPNGCASCGSGARLRSLAIWEDLILVATADAYMLALDARTGVVRWETRIAEGRSFMNTTGPIIADGKVVNGINGCTRLTEESCFITAHDARTGRELWRTFTIARPGEPGGDSWGDIPFALRGGGDVWNGGSWDPELGLVYFGTAQPKPWNAVSRGLTFADSVLYTNSTLALDVNDGHIVWYRQHIPAESFDLDQAYEQVLADVDGVPALLTAGKDGILWKIDRRDGTFLGLQETRLPEHLRCGEPGDGGVALPAGHRGYEDRGVGLGLPLDVRRPQLAPEWLSPRGRASGHPAQPKLHGFSSPGDGVGFGAEVAAREAVSGWTAPQRMGISESSLPTTSGPWRRSGVWSSGLRT